MLPPMQMRAGTQRPTPVPGRGGGGSLRRRRRGRQPRDAAAAAAAARGAGPARGTGGLRVAHETASLLGWAGLLALVCLHSTYCGSGAGAGPGGHSGMLRLWARAGGSPRGPNCIEHALATRPPHERRVASAYFDKYGDGDGDGSADSREGDGESGSDPDSRSKGGRSRLDPIAAVSELGGNLTDSPLLGRDEILQIRILYGGECTGQCSRVRTVAEGGAGGGDPTAAVPLEDGKGGQGGGNGGGQDDGRRDVGPDVAGEGSTWWRVGGFGNRRAHTGLSTPAYWKRPHYRFSSSDAILYLDGSVAFLHNVSVVNITLTERCLSTGSDHGTPSLAARAAEYLARICGIDTVIINQLMYGVRGMDGGYRDGVVRNAASDEIWNWSKSQLERYDSANFSDWFARKVGIIVQSALSFFLVTSVTSVIVRVLTSSGVVMIFPIFSLLRHLGLPANDRVLALSYPWIGRAISASQRRGIHPVGHLLGAHATNIFLVYLMYEACQAAWSSILYGKSIPEGLPIWIYGFAMIWEYFAMIFVRSALSAYFFPRILALYFVLYHVYFHSVPYGWFDVALIPLFLFTAQAMVYTVIAFEIPAVARGVVTRECPREVFNRLSWGEWSATLPPAWTLFLPLNSRYVPLYDQDVGNDATEEAFAGNDDDEGVVPTPTG